MIICYFIFINLVNFIWIFDNAIEPKIIIINTDIVEKDSLLILPDILINTIDSTNSETEYSTNDLALELMEHGFNYLNNSLYTESKIHFVKALKLNTNILNLDYFEIIDFGA